MGEIRLGPIVGIVVHYGPECTRPLCRNFQQLTVNTTTTARDKVTCKDCLEWMHA